MAGRNRAFLPVVADLAVIQERIDGRRWRHEPFLDRVWLLLPRFGICAYHSGLFPGISEAPAHAQPPSSLHPDVSLSRWSAWQACLASAAAAMDSPVSADMRHDDRRSTPDPSR